MTLAEEWSRNEMHPVLQTTMQFFAVYVYTVI